ncbi:group II truncated hemoglobin [Terrabacter sp. Soil810]|uniref:group II truncated hemoglobin n=1 Tax=Terrabacter sp. Soil810 TaxID=1736418 RepID=UPI00070FC38C|nr:group II truncated hemoglobin [Terrabacter sp. Soil810]KRF38531.1 oxidoreductase [Terrabacter sp. Soil810]
MGGVNEAELPTLYEWAGGLAALRRMIDCFYDRVEVDEALSGFFPGGVSEHHRAHVADWWAEVLGGPATYTERHGGYESMLRHHLGLAITAAQRHRFAATMSLAADDAELPGDPEFRAAIIGYLEWGSRLAMENSQPDADPVAHAPTPRWGWGVAPPYQG